MLEIIIFKLLQLMIRNNYTVELMKWYNIKINIMHKIIISKNNDV